MRQGRTAGELSKSLGVSPRTLRKLRRRDQLDGGERDDGVTTDERAEPAWLRRENQRRRQERDLLERAVSAPRRRGS